MRNFGLRKHFPFSFIFYFLKIVQFQSQNLENVYDFISYFHYKFPVLLLKKYVTMAHQ